MFDICIEENNFRKEKISRVEFTNIIQSGVFTPSFWKYSDKHDEIFLQIALELIGFIGENEISSSSVTIIQPILCSVPEGSRLQITAINTLILLGYSGLALLIDLANKDYQNLHQAILSRLCTIPLIQKYILVPGLLSEIENKCDGYVKLGIVSALNYCYSLVYESGAIPLLINLLEEGSVERIIVASAIHAAGSAGDSALIKLLRFHSSSRVKVAVASVLKWRRPLNPEMLQFVLEENEVISLSSKLPGSLCTYIGQNSAVIDLETNSCEGIVKVNPRDFLAALQRFVSIPNELSERIDLSYACNKYEFLLDSVNIDLIDRKFLPFDPCEWPREEYPEKKDREKIHISIIRALCAALKDENIAVRETAASSLLD